MKTIKYSISAGFILLALLFQSCEGYLDTYPSNAVEGGGAVTTEADVLMAIRGAYDGLTTNLYYGADFVVYGDVKGDDVQTLSSGRRTENAYRFSWRQITSPAGLWATPYSVISRVNLILNELELGVIPETDTVKDAKGQALALRALCHFNLLLTYGYPYLKDNGESLGVPLVRTVLGTYDTPARQSVADGYKMVVDDLQAAEKLISEGRKDGYMNRWAVKALLARVSLYKGDWDTAFVKAADVIGHSPYSLVPNGEYAGAWAKDYTSESLFDLYISSRSSGNRELLGYIAHPSGYATMCLTKDFMDILNEDPADVRLKLIKRFSFKDDPDKKYYFTNKYPGRNKNIAVNNVKVLRLSEIYLIAAEAALKKRVPDQASADKYLNAVRKRANPALADVTADEALILKERRKELVMEGHRFFDAMRLGKTITRSGGDHFLNKNDLISPNWNDYRVVLPIPQAEIDANPNIRGQQNPGY